MSERVPHRRAGGRRSVPPARFRTISMVSLAGLLLIIPSGALVRLTDSGLGCPDWPGCHGDVVPPLSGHAWIEYTNRIFSAIVVVLAVATWLAARRVPGAPRRLRAWAAVPALAGLAQGPLGGLTVAFDLHPLLVSSHFLLSVVALGGGTVVALQARDHAHARTRRLERVPAVLASAALAGLAGVIVTGVLVTAAGPHSGDPAVVRRIGTLGEAAAVHVRFVIAFVVLAIALGAWLARHRPSDRLAGRLTLGFLPVLGLQIALGEYQYRSRLPWEVVLAHVTVAGLVWAGGTAIAWLAARPQVAQARSERRPDPVPASVPEATASRHAAST